MNEMHERLNTQYVQLTGSEMNGMPDSVQAFSPLPFTFEMAANDGPCPALLAMKIAWSAMSAWIDETKKCSYFTPHFLQLSRNIMNSVTTMGRGLMSLKILGEDLSQAPMSIDDLLDLASYHIRVSYLGMMQTLKSYPQISAGLFNNQLSWSNTLLRLYRTKEKLEAQPRPNGSAAVSAAPAVSSQDGFSAFGGTAGISPARSFGAARAYRPMDPEKQDAASAVPAAVLCTVPDAVPAAEDVLPEDTIPAEETGETGGAKAAAAVNYSQRLRALLKDASRGFGNWAAAYPNTT